MPRKTQFTTDDIIQAAVELVRKKGLEGLSAPAVAEEMGSSTMPIYSHFKNMQALEDKVVRHAWALSIRFKEIPYTGDALVDRGIGYIRFARDEENLFRCMNSGRNLELKYEMHEHNWVNMGLALVDYEPFRDLDDQQRTRARYAFAMLCHGVATGPRLGFNKVVVDDDEVLLGFLNGAAQAIVKGFKDVPPIPEDKVKYVQDKIKKQKEDGH